MTILRDRLGTNPLHRMRNRIAAELLEEQWRVNYQVNKKYLEKSRNVSLRSLTCYDDQKIAVIVGAGPSLPYNLQDYVKHAPIDRCVTFVTDKAFPRVHAANIKSDHVLALNAKSPDGEVQGFWKRGETKDSTLVMPITADPATLEGWNGRTCLINGALPIDLTAQIEAETGLSAIPCGSNVGAFSYLLAGRLGFKTIVLIGMDYSFPSREQVVSKYPPGEPYIIFEHRDARGRTRWSSWDWFDSAISFFEYARYLSRNGVRTINCTEGGIIYDGEYIESAELTGVKL
jgi:hypothetical protein